MYPIKPCVPLLEFKVSLICSFAKEIWKNIFVFKF